MSIIDVRVQHIHAETPDVRMLRLVAHDGAALPPFTAGAHIDVHLDGGLVRQYSLCNAPSETGFYEIAIKLEPASRGGSQALHTRLNVGDRLTISAPRNAFALHDDAHHHALCAAGIGITPLLCMAQVLQDRGASFHLHYFSRSREHTAYRARLASSDFADRVTFHEGLDPAAVPSTLTHLLAARPEGAHLYTCGPRPFMDAVLAAAQAWPADAVHLEHFSADPDLDTSGASFVVRLAKTGGAYVVPPDRSIVSVLADHNVFIDTSCEQGICGTCILDVIEGVPDHRDDVLMPDERESGKKVVACVSRAKTAVLVLDF